MHKDYLDAWSYAIYNDHVRIGDDGQIRPLAEGKLYDDYMKAEKEAQSRALQIARNHEASLRHAADNLIEKVIFNPPATIVFWKDGDKTIVKCKDGEAFDKEKGIAMAFVKHFFEDFGFYYNVFRKWVE